MASQTWLVTGASSGIGLAIVQALLRQGHRVGACARNTLPLSQLRDKSPAELLPITCDVTKQEDVDAAFAATAKEFGRLDVVFNNAGYSVIGEVEAVSIKDAMKLFETNVWGAMRVSQVAVSHFRDQKCGGHLIQTSSLQGTRSDPACGVYAASKWALEALSEAMAAEVDPAWKIKITIAQLGSFRTPFLANFKSFSHPAYVINPNLPGSQMQQALSTMTPESIPGDPEKVAQRILDVALVVASGRGRGSVDVNPVGLRVMLGQEVPASIEEKRLEEKLERERGLRWAEGLNF